MREFLERYCPLQGYDREDARRDLQEMVDEAFEQGQEYAMRLSAASTQEE